jgi:integrase
VFEEQREVSLDRAATAAIGVEDDAFVFSRELDASKPWTPDSVTSRFVTIRDELGYKNMRFHDLRHFAATRLMAAGVPVRTVSGRLGHANPSTTLSVYSHFVEASDQEAAGIMGGLVSGTKAKHAARSADKKPVKKAASTRKRI